MKLFLKKIICLNCMLISCFSQAENTQSKNGSLSAHVHGSSELTIVFEQQKLEIELVSPAMNLIGFEHIAKTEAEILAVNNAEAWLAKHNNVFDFFQTECELIEQAVDVSNLLLNTHHHDKPKQHQHKAEHAGQQSEGSHYDIFARYRYFCKKASSSLSMSVNIFDKFQGVHQIAATWITMNQQGIVTLNSKERIINMSAK